MSDSQTYEIDRLRAANVQLTNALKTAVITIERLVTKHGEPLMGTLALAKAALKNNQR